AHPHAQGPAARPGTIVQCTLRGDRAADRVLDAAEGDEKSIAGGAEFVARVTGNRVAKDAAMFFQRSVILVCAQLGEARRRVLDVAEEESDGAGGFSSHPARSSTLSVFIFVQAP